MKVPIKLRKMPLGQHVRFGIKYEKETRETMGSILVHHVHARTKVKNARGVYVGYRRVFDTTHNQHSGESFRDPPFFVALVVVDPTRDPVRVPVNSLRKLDI
jgi:hypothetical protein